MKAPSKGQQVKTFKTFIPQPDLTSSEMVMKVYFRAADGMFLIYLPEHIAASVGDKFNESNRERYIGARVESNGVLACPIANEIVEQFNRICLMYRDLLKNENRVKVILLTVQVNASGQRADGTWRNRKDQPFAISPMLGFNFDVMWKVDKNLYRQRGPDEKMTAVGSAENVIRNKGSKLIPWTQEREDVLTAMRDGFFNLIDHVDAFCDDIEGNLDAIEGGKSNPMVLLGAPA
jgi:hypothetical protein